jgi:hypothetical protein
MRCPSGFLTLPFFCIQLLTEPFAMQVDVIVLGHELNIKNILSVG